MGLINFWFDLPTWLRAVLGIVLIGVAVLIWFASDGHQYAIGLGVMGLIFLLFCNAGNNKSGYKF